MLGIAQLTMTVCLPGAAIRRAVSTRQTKGSVPCCAQISVRDRRLWCRQVRVREREMQRGFLCRILSYAAKYLLLVIMLRDIYISDEHNDCT
ncbi:MAG: hypothetical protein ABSE07_09930 [Methanoregula sp.]|jgi:hypothetical protein